MQAQLAARGVEADRDSDRLSQAARFVTHLQLQLAELDRREQQLNDQANALLEQQLIAKRAAKVVQEQLAHSRHELHQQSAQLLESEETLRQRVLILKQQEEDFARRFESFQLERDTFQKTQQAEKTAFELDRQARLEEFQAEQARWRAEQERVREQVAADEQQATRRLVQAREAFQAEQAQLRKAVEAEQAGAWGEVEQFRADFAREMERERAQLETLKAELHAAHASERAEWTQQCEAEQARVTALKTDLQQQRAEQERVNLQWAEHRKEEKRQHLEALEEISRERLGGLDLREREIQQREIDLQKRFRLHEDHLDRTRRDLATQRAEMEWQQQQQRIWIEQVETSIRQRLGQMRHFRDLLAQRERCLADEQSLFTRQRQESESQLQHQRDNLSQERARTAEIRQVEVQTLLTQQSRIEQEVEQLATQRAEAAEIAQQLVNHLQQLQRATQHGTDDSPANHLAQVVNVLSRQIVELEASRKSLSELQQEQRTENIRLSAWIEARESWVQEREAIFNRQLEELSQREQMCQAERETWRSERIQVEQLIRNLVQQLENAAA